MKRLISKLAQCKQWQLDDGEVLCPLCFRHISDDEPSLKDVAEFLNHDVIKIVERKDKLIEQMRQALEEIVACGRADSEDAQEVVIAKAALEAAERG